MPKRSSLLDIFGVNSLYGLEKLMGDLIGEFRMGMSLETAMGWLSSSEIYFDSIGLFSSTWGSKAGKMKVRDSDTGRLWLDFDFDLRARCLSIRSSCFSRRILFVARVSASRPLVYNVSRFKGTVDVLTSYRSWRFQLTLDLL